MEVPLYLTGYHMGLEPSRWAMEVRMPCSTASSAAAVVGADSTACSTVSTYFGVNLQRYLAHKKRHPP